MLPLWQPACARQPGLCFLIKPTRQRMYSGFVSTCGMYESRPLSLAAPRLRHVRPRPQTMSHTRPVEVADRDRHEKRQGVLLMYNPPPPF